MIVADVVLAVGVSWLILASGALIPFLEGLVTNDLAPGWLSVLVMAVLSAVAGVVTTAIDTHGTIPLQKSLAQIALTALIAFASHYGFTVAGALPKLKLWTGAFGLGPRHRPASALGAPGASEGVIMLAGWGHVAGPRDAIAQVRVIRDTRPPGAPRRTWGRAYRRWERDQLALLAGAARSTVPAPRAAPVPTVIPPPDVKS